MTAKIIWTVASKSDHETLNNVGEVLWNRCFKTLDDAKRAAEQSALSARADLDDAYTPAILPEWEELVDNEGYLLDDSEISGLQFAVVPAALL